MVSTRSGGTTITPPRVELILSQLEELPTLPAVAARLLEVTTSSTSCAPDVAAIIETDQALTSKVLALVRRAATAAREVKTVERAIVLLGFEAVRNAVLAVQVYDTFSGVEPQPGTILDRVEFWKHSLAVGCAARLVAGRMRLGKRQDEAFACGLLHDLGRIALDACLPKSYARVLRQSRATGQSLCDAERDLLGIDHTVAGKRVAARWKLPQTIVDSIWLHHQPPATLPESIEGRDLVQAVHLADRIVSQQRIGIYGTQCDEPLESAAEVVGLGAADITAVIESLPEQMERSCQVVGLGELTGNAVYAQAMAQANTELGRVNAALADANRRLAVRAGCFDALGAFTKLLTLDDSIASSCVAAASCVREVLQLDATVGFYCDAGGTLYHAGVCHSDGVRVEVFTGSSECNGDDAPGRSAVVGLTMGPAPMMARPVVRRYPELLGPGSVRMWPIAHAGLVIGGVLFAADGENSAGERLAAEEFEALSAAFGLAVAGAADRWRSDRLNEELADANRQLHEARREMLRTRSVAMIAETAAGAAHELNNPLAVISGRAQMLTKGQADPDTKRHAEIIHRHAQRASDIVTELVRFAKPDPPQPVVIPLEEYLAGLVRRWEERSSIQAGQLEAKLSDSGVQVFADPAQLGQIFDALLANAIEATTPEKARLVINSASATSDDRVVVTVEDNGAGMAPGVLEHAVDPFFSHRAAGRGRGMGLSQAVRLATNNGGRLWLESSPGVGTTAFVELPAARG